MKSNKVRNKNGTVRKGQYVERSLMQLLAIDGNGSADATVQWWADIPVQFDRMSKRDNRKLSAYKTCISNAASMAERGLVNSYMISPNGNASDRIKTVGNAIAKLSKLNAGALDGGARLKQHCLEQGFIALCKLEVYGRDNAHYQVTNMPANDRDYHNVHSGHGSLYQVMTSEQRKGKLASMADRETVQPTVDQLPDHEQKQLQILVEWSQKPRVAKRVQVADLPRVRPTKCKQEARPLPTSKPFANLTWNPEKGPDSIGPMMGHGLQINSKAAPDHVTEYQAGHKKRHEAPWYTHPNAVETAESKAEREAQNGYRHVLPVPTVKPDPTNLSVATQAAHDWFTSGNRWLVDGSLSLKSWMIS